jgi:sugar-specific transcriptional regulator TrmB
MKAEPYIENLVKLGLTESEAKVYLNLLKKKNFTATEISRISGVPRTKIYEVLYQLINKGLCVEILGGVKKYAAVDPETAFIGLQQKMQQELESKKILLSNLLETLSPLYNSQKGNKNPLDYIHVVRERNSIVKNFELLERMATEEVLSLVKGPPAMNVAKPYNIEQYDSMKRGVKYKVIYPTDDFGNPHLLKSIEAFAEAGEEVRIANKLPIPFKMHIFDEKTVMFTLEDRVTSKPSLTALIIEHLDLAQGLKRVFNLYWQNSIPLEEFKTKYLDELGHGEEMEKRRTEDGKRRKGYGE